MFKIQNNRLDYTILWPRSTWPQTDNPALTVINQLRSTSPQLNQLLAATSSIGWSSTVTDNTDHVELIISIELSPTAEQWLALGMPINNSTLEELESLVNKKG